MLKQKSSMRLKKRYLLINSENNEIVEKAILDYIGILGYAKAAPFFVDEKTEKGKLILAIERSSLENVRAAFEMCKEKIEVLRVSGTIRGLDKK